MDSEQSAPPLKRIPLGRTRRRLSFENRLQLWMYLLGLPSVAFCFFLLQQQQATAWSTAITLASVCAAWALAVSFLMEQIVRPLQTLANVVSALREDDYSFRARGARRNDALGDLALEVNALAGTLQSQRTGALEAMALLERVMSSMESPMLAFHQEGRLILINSAAEKAFGLRAPSAVGRSASDLSLAHLLQVEDESLVTLRDNAAADRWMVRRSAFRLRGLEHHLFLFSDVSRALREEERQAWERLIRVLGHEINNSLAPIKSIAGSLRKRLPESGVPPELARGLEVIEDRSESLNRFLQAYRQLMRLPSPRRKPVPVAGLLSRVAQVEARLEIVVEPSPEATISVDADQIEQALINLIRNAVEAALAPEASADVAPRVVLSWEVQGMDLHIRITDTGLGLSNSSNLFVPFYTTKPEGTGIGLVLAQQIAEAHGGKVTLENRPDARGCIATLRLPM